MANHMAKSSQYDDNFILAESYYSSVINSKKDQQDRNNLVDLHRDSDMSSSILPSTSDFSNNKKPEIALIEIENTNFQNNKRNFPTNHLEMNSNDYLKPNNNNSYGVSQFDSKNKKYSTIIEMNGQNTQTNANTLPFFNKPITNRTIYIDPSPSNITRIHINHLDTNNRVNDKIKEVNERFKSVNPETASSIISPICALTIRDRCNNVMNVNTSNNHMIPPSKPIQFHVINQSTNETNEPVKKVSHGTSPIKIFKSKATDMEPITDNKFRDASTQMEIDEKTPVIQRKKVTLITENTNINESKANQDNTLEEKTKSKSTEQVIEKIYHEEPPAQSNKNKLLNLEKSKLIVVNLTPQPPVHNLNETEETNHVNKSKSAGINMSHDYNLNTSTTDLKEKKLDVEIQTDAELEDDHVNFKKITQEEPSRKNKLKDFHAQLEDHRLFDNDQTPVSTSHKTRSINTHDNLEPIHHHSTHHTEEINEKDVSSKKTIIKENNMNTISMKNGRNDMLNLKSNNYYNDVKTKNNSDNDHDEYPSKAVEKSSKIYRQEDQEHPSNMNLKQTKYASNNEDEIMDKKQSEMIARYEKGNFESNGTQTSNSNINKNLLRRDTIAGLPRIPITDSFLNLNELSKTINSAKATEKFYDGSKVWTAAMNIVKNFDKHDGTDREPIISGEEANEETRDQIHKEPTHVSKKKHLKVKIKLPDEKSSQRKPPKRKRSCQRCCFSFFLLLIAFIGLGFIVYFFAWDLIFSSSRGKFFFSN